MSLFGQYISETRDLKIVESEKGFATYSVIGKECYIEDIYVAPEHRFSGYGTQLADQIKKIALEAGCTHIFGTTNCRFKDPDASLKAMLAYGFKISKVFNDIILLRMEIWAE